MSILHKLQSRYAVKEFDPNKIIPEEQITELLEITNLSASALGLQPYEFVVIHDKELQAKLAEHSFNGIEVGNASHLVVFASKTKVSKEYILDYIERTEKIRDLETGSMDVVKELTLNLMSGKSDEEIFTWSQKQAYLALGTLLIAAEDLKIDMCPMEVIDSEKYNEILGLSDMDLHACVVGVLGYRKENDPAARLKKTRRNLGDIVQLRY